MRAHYKDAEEGPAVTFTLTAAIIEVTADTCNVRGWKVDVNPQCQKVRKGVNNY